MGLRAEQREQLKVARVRDAIAGHLKHCAESSTAYFYTINGDYRHPFSLANRCGAFSQSQWRSLVVSCRRLA